MPEEQNSGKFIPIDWFVPDDIVTKYATNMVVQHSEHEFTVLFFEAQPPIIVGPTDQRQKALQDITSIRARCVARIVVAPERMEEFVKVLSDNFQRYKKSGKDKREE